jgi:hypothetical protein
LPAVDEREQAAGDNPSLAAEVVQPTPTRDVTPAVRLDHRYLVGLVDLLLGDVEVVDDVSSTRTVRCRARRRLVGFE